MTGVDLLVVGGTGLLGRAVVEQAAAEGRSIAATYHSSTPIGEADWHQVDIRLVDDLAGVIARLRPRAIINAAYVNRGDDLFEVTTRAPSVMAGGAEHYGSRFVHVSTDIVFDGQLGRPYEEADPVSPVNAYGRAKAEAEDAIFSYDASTVAVRTSLLWGGSGDGGPQVRLLRDPAVKFFTNEIRNPLRVDRLAAVCLELCDRPEITGVLHAGGEDAVDRLTFARALAPLARVDPAELNGIEAEFRPDRPADVRLDSSLARHLLAAPLPGIHTDAPHVTLGTNPA